MQQMQTRKNAAAWRNIKCPVCKAGKNMPCHNVLGNTRKVRQAHLPRVLAASQSGGRRNGKRPKASLRNR